MQLLWLPAPVGIQQQAHSVRTGAAKNNDLGLLVNLTASQRGLCWCSCSYCVFLLVQLQIPQVLHILGQGIHPFEVLEIGHLLPRVQQQLSNLLVSLHRAFGACLVYNSDGVPKDKQPQVGPAPVL
jgi:hypothetical protein